MKNIFLTIILAVSLFSCDSFLTEDASPNNPQDSTVPPNQKLAAAMTGIFRTQAVNLNLYGNRLSYAWGFNVNAFAGGNLDEFTYNYTTSTQSVIFENLYLNIDNLQNILNYNNSDHKYDNHFAIAKLLKANGMLYIISLYGDAPYKEAFQQLKNPTPKYDDDKEIFKDLLSLIDEARSEIDADLGDHVGPEDVIFSGDMAEWKKFANTLELKMLLRLSNTTDPAFVTLRTSRFAALQTSGASFIDSDMTINPGYNDSTTEQYTPFFFTFGLQANGSTTNSYRANVAGDYIAQVLNGQISNTHVTSTVKDPRGNRNFRVNQGGTVDPTLNDGFVHGQIQGDVAQAAGGTAPKVINNLGRHITGLSPIQPQLSNGASRNGYFMLNAESQFLQAEAIQRGYLMGDAKAAFEAGIAASFNWYSTPWGNYTPTVITATAYITNTANLNGLGWNGSSNKIEAIMTQKWLALNSITGIEPYLDQVRTGFPWLPLPVIATKTVRPNRLLYPNSEYASNSANVPNVVNDDLYSINAFSPFYLK